jgi:hypothetical protein
MMRRVLVFIVLASACGIDSGNRLRVGDPAPALWSEDGSGRPVVAWVMTGEDYLGCASAAGDLRHLQMRFGNAVRLSVVYVGDHPQWVAGFIRRERVSARISQFSRSEFRKVFGRESLPSFYVVSGGTIVDRAASPNGVDPPPEASETIERAVEDAIGSRVNRGRRP